MTWLTWLFLIVAALALIFVGLNVGGAMRWTAVDEHSANATLTDGALSITLLFRFDASGLMTSMRAEARGRIVGKEVSSAPWEGTWSNHQRVGSMTVPLTGEVAWLLPEGRKTYWRGTVTSLRHGRSA